MRKILACEKCDCENLRMKKAVGMERLMVLLTGKRKYHCVHCEHAFRAPDRRRYPRGEPSDAAARTANSPQ